MKTIAIIGGMGPQASLHAHSRLLEKLSKKSVKATIVHVSLQVNPFFSVKPVLELTASQKTLLQNLDADIGFIACNTAHFFFDEFQKYLKFKLLHIIEENKISEGSTIVCSPTSRTLKLFGEDVQYLNDENSEKIEQIISDVNQGIVPKKNVLKPIIAMISNPVFACTEISMLAHAEKLAGHDTLEILIDRVIDVVSEGARP